jgi:hypothetical protein
MVNNEGMAIPMNNLDAIARMAINGWPVIPAVPGDKKPMCRWAGITRENYKFDGMTTANPDPREGEGPELYVPMFRDAPENVNCGLICDDLISVVDFDNHDAEPNGLTVYNRLKAENPEIFDGAIDEITQSGGHHVYYRGIAGGVYTVDFGGIKVEVLCGRKLSYCWPSVTKDGDYRVISTGHFLGMMPRDLPPLPAIFNRPKKPKDDRPVFRQPSFISSGGLTSADADAVVDGLVESYLRGASKGDRHPRGRILACALAGHGILTESDVRRGVRDYFRRCKPDASPTGMEKLVVWALRHPDSEPPTPWKLVYEYRARRAASRLKSGGGTA